MSKRDTHFAGFAKLLRKDISNLAVAHHEGKFGNPHDLDEYERLVHLLIAQRAYDLVWHTIHALGLDHDSIPFQDIYRPEEDIPDLTKWPHHS